MNEEEAILQMELLGHQFYMYMDSENNKPTVVYKRNDGRAYRLLRRRIPRGNKDSRRSGKGTARSRYGSC